MTLKLLIADDARDVAEVVAFGVRMTWPDCQVTIAASGEEALRRVAEESADLVVLDVALPPPNGFEICRRIRAISRVPILILTVCDSTLDKVRAFDLGADDYLTKPFDHLELLARLRALVRRTRRDFGAPASLTARHQARHAPATAAEPAESSSPLPVQESTNPPPAMSPIPSAIRPWKCSRNTAQAN